MMFSQFYVLDVAFVRRAKTPLAPVNVRLPVCVQVTPLSDEIEFVFDPYPAMLQVSYKGL